MKVKICGITDVETALAAAEYGADAIGFVFAESKRRVSIEQAREIIQQLPKPILKVGVFVNEKKEVIHETVERAGLTAIQLHGDESPEFCNGFPVPVIKALSIASATDLNQIHDYPCDFLLLDSPRGSYYGGNGETFDWGILREFDFGSKQIILAGGLHSGNVVAAIEEVRPAMVDVSSGVETNGKKDLQKIQEFIDRAKNGVEVR